MNQLKQYRQRWQAVAAIELAEQRAASVEQRWQQLNALLLLASGLGLEPHSDEQVVYQRWSELKKDLV